QATSHEPVTVYASSSASGPWTLIGLRVDCGERSRGLFSMHCDFDLADGGLASARFFKVEDGEIYPCLAAGTITEGADIHAVLAERWENPDDLTWRFHLRRGVRFHDGRLMEAADVVASLERARHHPQSQVAGYLIAVASVREVDGETVEIATARPYPVLLNKL